MKRFVPSLLLVLATNIISPLASPAYAAGVQDVLMNALVQSQSANQIQELLKVNQALDTGSQNEMVNAAIKTVLQEMMQGVDANHLPVLEGNNEQAIEMMLREEVRQAASKKIAPYQEEINAIATLLGQDQKLTPNALNDDSSLAGAPENYKKVLNMTATAYASGVKDNGKWNDLTYVGGKVQKGVAAVDPAIIPMGTKLWIEGYGEALAVDQGIKENRIDLAFNDRQEALDYGIQNIKVYILN